MKYDHDYDYDYEPKKPIYKKWWFWLIIVLLFFYAKGVSGENDEPATSTPTAAVTPTSTATPTPEATPEPTPTEESLTFELIAGEAGEYGELFTINKNTEFEETYYIYHVPAGTYTVTNTGEYMNQLNVYSDEIVVNDSGWEEPAEVGYVKLFDVGESATVTIEEGYFIEIHEPSHFTFELIK